LRVVQTGVQLLTGFLVTLPFQLRFDRLDDQMRIVYVTTVGCAIASTLCLIAPVAMHRLVFRQRRLKPLVSASHRFALIGIALLAAALVGVTVVTFAMVLGKEAAWVAGGGCVGRCPAVVAGDPIDGAFLHQGGRRRVISDCMVVLPTSRAGESI
jgi:hypothetical protein